MDITAAGVKTEKRIELSVFDRLIAATCKMAVTTGNPAGFAHVLGHMHKVHLRVRHTRSRGGFYIGSCRLVADEAVNPGLVGEVKGCIFPAKAGVTTGATGPVAGEVYEEVVDGFGGLAQIDPLLITRGEG